MKWEDYASISESILNSRQVPSSLEIIGLIKKVNPTSLALPDADRQRGYRIKSRLQNLLLEHYGESFALVPHPASQNIILIKHRFLPSVDACHADATALSNEALERVETGARLCPGMEEPKHGRGKGHRETGTALSAREILKKAQALLERYDYAAAEEVLAGVRAQGNGDLQAVMRAAAILLDEIGAYQRCIDTLLGQPRNVLKDKGVRQMLAVAYHRNGCLPEARAILDELHVSELEFEALFAYADISFKDGNLLAAFQLVTIADGKEGFFSGMDNLRKEIEAAMSVQAEPVLQKAQAALHSADTAQARQLAREALELYPNCQEARAVVCAIEAIEEEAQLAELWDRFEMEGNGERRIALLNALLERDTVRRDSIRKLLAEEKERSRRRLFEEHLESLRGLVLQECWPECFDAVTLLMKQPEFQARAPEVLALSPFFSVLHENRRLNGIPERSAKDLWLRLVKAKIALATGDGAECFETFEELKAWFGQYPEFKNDHLVLLEREREKARQEIAVLLEKGEAPDCAASEVRLIHGSLRRKMQVLPVEERRELARTMEERLARLDPEPEPGHTLAEFREALRTGNSEKSSFLRREIADSPALEAIEAEFAASFHIACEPLELEFAEDMPVDLTTEPPLTIRYSAGHRTLLKEGPESYVMIDFAAKAACRMTSPVFGQADLHDSTKKGCFLFVEKKDEGKSGDRLWRAELSVERAAFTASFDMREWFEIDDGFSVKNIMSSSERDTDYYLTVEHDEGRSPAKLLKKRLAPKGTVETFQLRNLADLKIWRLSSYPDAFIVGGEGEMKHLNRNLSVQVRLGMTPNIYKIDRRNGHIYGLEECWLTRRNQGLELVECFQDAVSIGLWDSDRCHGISFDTDTALIVIGDGRQVFYNLRNNKFSNKIRAGRVIPCGEDGSLYSFDYSSQQGKLRLREITRDIHTKLRWGQFFIPAMKQKKRDKLILWFHNHDNFVYRPEHWGAGGVPVAW